MNTTRAVMLNFSLAKAEAIDAEEAIKERKREAAASQAELEATARLDHEGTLEALKSTGAAGQKLASDFELQLVKVV